MINPAGNGAGRIATMIVLAFMFAAASGCAGDSAVASGPAEGAAINLVGRVKSKGHDPFVWAALITEEAVFKLVGPKADELLREHQLEVVRIRGVVVAAGDPPLLPPEIEVRRYLPAD